MSNANYDTLANHIRELEINSLRAVHKALFNWVGFVELLVDFEDIPQPNWLAELAALRDISAEAIETYQEMG